MPAAGPVPEAAVCAEELGTFSGWVASAGASNGFGTLGCSELQSMFQRDAFVHCSHLEGLRVGDKVTFFAALHPHGLLQAWDVARVAALPPPEGRRLAACAAAVGRHVAEYNVV
mmetsp:Transcript_41227/g.116715  ORF Transcript_41227/g.116715 Transcript_41227/m.116715 type:complete len:114 (+) Transcript_41227:301-642(+)